MLQIYLDSCCFNRPFDAPNDDRIVLEAEATLRILARIESGEWKLVVSDAVLYELRRIPDTRRRDACLAMARSSSLHVRTTPEIRMEASRLAGLGFSFADAAHLAFARFGRADLFLTVDDRLLRKSRLAGENIPLVVANPVAWLLAQEERKS